MKNWLFTFLIGGSLLHSSLCAVDQKMKKEMVSNLDTIQNIFEARYAPYDWKYKYAGWEMEREFQKAKNTVLAIQDISLKEYQQIVREVLQTTKDYHVAVRFFSTEAAELPFNVKGINGKYFFVALDHDKMPEEYPLEIGDELIEFDGKPVHEVVETLRKGLGETNLETDQALAEICLTHRMGLRGDVVPRGPVTITVKSANSNKILSFQLIWNYQPEKIKSGMFGKKPSEDFLQAHHFKNKNFVDRQLLNPLAIDLGFAKTTLEGDNETDSYHKDVTDPNALGLKKSFIPTLGPKAWETDDKNIFHAYIFFTPDNRPMGYIRIPHYILPPEKAAEEFAQIVALMEETTEGLIIDQVNNFGGNVFCLYSLVAMLTDKPLHTPKHRMMITQQDVAEALQMLEELAPLSSNEEVKEALGTSLYGYPLNYQVVQFIRHYAQFIIEEWNAGHRLTQPHYLWGVDHINPSPHANYTKPILVIVNELDFSGGDFFPAILQDNHRAVIFGTTTAGAGGYIDGQSYGNRFGIAGIRLTASIAERINAQPIENLGVTPDIVYKLSENDVRYGYKEYTDAILKALNGMFSN